MSENPTACIVGGSGFVGQCIARELRRHNVTVLIFDVAFSQDSINKLPKNVQMIKGDVRSKKDLVQAFTGCSVVFHIAAYGMSGRAVLNRELVESINVGGTENVIQACQEANVPSLLFASSVNTVSGIEEIYNGTEDSTSYLPEDQFVDNYSRTKAVGERLIIRANGLPLHGTAEERETRRLKTAALRFPGVYGLDEQRHMPRIVKYIKSGLFCCTYSRGESAELQWVNGDNAAQGFYKAWMALLPEKKSIAAGQVYFINDGIAVDSFEFFRPIIQIYTTFPRFRIPWIIMYYVAALMELLFELIPIAERFMKLEITPIGITRMEVIQCGLTHTFSIEKARKQLGYVPSRPNDLSEIIAVLKRDKAAEDAELAGEKLTKMSSQSVGPELQMPSSPAPNLTKSKDFPFMNISKFFPANPLTISSDGGQSNKLSWAILSLLPAISVLIIAIISVTNYYSFNQVSEL